MYLLFITKLLNSKLLSMCPISFFFLGDIPPESLIFFSQFGLEFTLLCLQNIFQRFPPAMTW